MATDIKCPNCGHRFPMEEAVSEEFKNDLREKMLEYKRQRDDEFIRKEAELQRQAKDRETLLTRQAQEKEADLQRQAKEREALLTRQVQEEREQLRRTVAADYENQLQLLQHANREGEEKLKEARRKEMEYLQKEQDLTTKEQELELTLQRRLLEERTALTEKIRKEELDKVALKETEHQLRVRELEKQLEDQKKLAEEMKRKAEQGSTQLQGEIQELALEEMLRTAFPFDLVEEVGKGIRGADCIQTVRNSFGQVCGKIIYESKRTKEFSKDWPEKLKADMRHLSADLAILVTQTMPRDMDRFGERDGVWICTFSEVGALAHVLRDGLLKVYNASRSQENQGEKMVMLYRYLTSNEFAEQWKAIREGFASMRQSIQRERDAMEKLWKAREKQLEKVLLNAAHIKGSIEGIAGSDSVDLRLTDEEDEASDLLLN
ncbi:DUF2130 domain-containing protein [Dinghuibacter silviterrae]|uniref:DUF2130 domain-containing protein n=1 Tax=Dinghuibacter silviterrae TaxID=1539049 RepID=A0A4R8DF51_9BACT|nr:DUF2130 domain-containing protein [Dinghuibacter silviterrae]TDW96213.1 hypothetical protein EDB95_4038 [Dinghuibacter silviterrae]